MDTRTKIVTAEAVPRGAVIVCGLFEVLRVTHARQVREIRERNQGLPLVALLQPRPDALFSLPMRVRMAAALRMVDYVLIIDAEDLKCVLERLDPAQIVLLDEPPLGTLKDAG
jgi:hypothetical protein